MVGRGDVKYLMGREDRCGRRLGDKESVRMEIDEDVSNNSHDYHHSLPIPTPFHTHKQCEYTLQFAGLGLHKQGSTNDRG